MNPEGNLLQTSVRSGNLEYQALKLDKVMETRHSSSNAKGLKYTKGLKPIIPDTEIRSDLLKGLFPTDDKESKSNCDMLMVVAMYNEKSNLLDQTMIGIAENLEYFANAGVNIDRLACIIIVDGMTAFLSIYNKEKNFFKEYFDERQVKDRFNVDDLNDCTFQDKNDYDEFIHCFIQKRTFGRVNKQLKIIFAVKQYNKRKLNTHL